MSGSHGRLERWHRRHANGWTAEVVRDERGRWRAAAHPDGGGGTYSLAGGLDAAQAVAESRVPLHECGAGDCADWSPGGD